LRHALLTFEAAIGTLSSRASRVTPVEALRPRPDASARRSSTWRRISAAVADLRLGAECVRHARMFFDRAPFDLASAAPGTFAVAPATGMLDRLERDYESMTGMVFGPIPAFDDVVASITGLERRLNQRV
jgi:hypothetical protein